jgi:hypothetical protein
MFGGRETDAHVLGKRGVREWEDGGDGGRSEERGWRGEVGRKDGGWRIGAGIGIGIEIGIGIGSARA